MFETLFKYPWDDFLKGQIRFALRPEVVLLAAVAAAAAAWWYYRRAPAQMTQGRRRLLLVLRAVPAVLLVALLFHPVLRLPVGQSRDCFVAVLVDDSKSMRIQDAGPKGSLDAPENRRSRLDAARALLGKPGKAVTEAEQGLVERLSEICPVRMFKFSADAEPIGSIGELNAQGGRTNLYAAMQVVDTELRGVPVVGVVMVTDGAANAGAEPEAMARVLRQRERPVPVFCVGLGEEQPPRDYEVMRVQAPREVRANTSFEVLATVRSAGYGGKFDVALCQGDKVLQTVKVGDSKDAIVSATGGNSFLARVRFNIPAEEKGTQRYVVQVAPGENEVILDNNRHELLVRVTDKRLPVLYLEGSPREEYRFLRRALFRDKDFRIASVLRVGGEKQDFITQGAEPEDGLQDGFPKDLEHLYRFEAVIVGDIEADYLSKQQLENIERFVREGGRGFVMLGGVNSFNLGKYQGTVVEKMLPIVLPPATAAYEQREFAIEMTATGEKHTVMQQSEDPYVNRNIWSKMPTLVGLNPIKELKPGALCLATEARTANPVLSVQQYGAGRSAAFTSGGSWHWRMGMPAEEEYHEKFWKQLVRWLAVRSKAKLSLELGQDSLGRREMMNIRATLLDNQLQPVNDAAVTCTLEDPFRKKHPLNLEWSLSPEGIYQAQYELLDPGEYAVEVEATLKDGTKLTESGTFFLAETLQEFTEAGQKTALLKSISEITGGRYVPPAEVQALPKELGELVRQQRRSEMVWEQRDLWDTPLLLGLIAACLAGEWFLRRRGGMM